MDLVVGLGEIGGPLMQLLKDRNFQVEGFDIKTPTQVRYKHDFIHICIPFSKDFHSIVNLYKKFGKVVIHSTVKPGTSKELGVIYSPIRGIHNNLYEHLKHFSKYYSGKRDIDFEKRFANCVRVEDSTELELTKILVDTTYYGVLIAYRKKIDSKYKVCWEFANEIHQMFGNRPIMYNDDKPIGGHCIMENLDLIDEPKLKDWIDHN